MKVDCKNYKGIAYVQLNELPLAQQEKILQNSARDFFIKIMIDGKIVSQCIQYKDYCQWYDSVFAKKPEPVNDAPVPAVNMGSLVLNKI